MRIMIRWGIIGPGTIANKFAKEVNKSGNGKLISVYGRNKERAKIFADKYSIEKYYSDINEFLKDDNIDAVYIATPHNFHMEHAKKCIKAKKNVLCEKPFSYDCETGKEVLALAKENGVFIMEALWTIFLPSIKQAKEWVDENRIGKVKLITANFGFRSEEDINSRLFNPNLAGGALLDVGIYPILFSSFIMNSAIAEVKATAVMSGTNVDATDVINLKYEDGTLASLTCSIASDTENTAVIYGEKGKIVIRDFWMAKEACLHTADYEEKYEDEYTEAGYKFEIIEANNCIANNKLESEVASHALTLNLAQVMDKVRKQIGLIYPFE